MPTKLITKNSSTASAVPTAGQLDQGELAVNVTDKRLFTKDSGGTVRELGTNPTSVTTPTINNATGVNLQYGGSTKLATTTTGIDVTGTAVVDALTNSGSSTLAGNIFFNSTSGGFRFQTDAGVEKMTARLSTDDLKIENGSGVQQLLIKNSGGIDVTGTVTADGLTVDKGSEGTYATISGDNASGGRGLAFTSSTNNLSVGAKHTIDALSGNGAIEFATGSTTRALIDYTGDISFYEDTGTTAKFFWDASAEALGIGTSSPQSFTSLQVKTATDRNFAVFDNAAGVTLCGLTDAGSSAALRIAGQNVVFTGAGGSGSEHMRIDSSGNVGIGTTSPSVDGIDIVKGTGASTYVRTSDGTVTSLAGVAPALGGGLIGTTSNHPMLFYANNTERARITSSGELLVNYTTSLSSVVGVRSTASATPCIATFNTAGAGSYQAKFYNNNTTALIGSITNNGNIGTLFNTTSDERLKENIVDTTHTVDINDIKVRQYDWKDTGEHQRYGFIAQELELVYPEAVHSPEDPEEMKAVDYSKLVPLLVKEIQDLKAEVAALKGA